MSTSTSAPATTTRDRGSAASSYGCRAEPPNSTDAWSKAKRAWCCRHEDKGCLPVNEQPFDCQDGYEDWEEAWRVEKQEWCCMEEGRGCQGPSVLRAVKEFQSARERGQGIRGARLGGMPNYAPMTIAGLTLAVSATLAVACMCRPGGRAYSASVLRRNIAYDEVASMSTALANIE